MQDHITRHKNMARYAASYYKILQQLHASSLNIPEKRSCRLSLTVSHFSYAPLFKGPHFFTKMLESNILYDNLLIDILSV